MLSALNLVPIVGVKNIKIEKSKNIVGNYLATCHLGTSYFVGGGKSHSSALDDLFAIIYWNLGIERPKINQNENKDTQTS